MYLHYICTARCTSVKMYSFHVPAFQAYGQTFINDDVFLAWVGAFAAICNALGRIMWGTLADRYSFKVGLLACCCRN